MQYLWSGFALVAFGCLVIGLRQAGPLVPSLAEAGGRRRMRVLAVVVLGAPILVAVIVAVLVFAVWRTDPLLRLAHMLWVLGLWMIGTVAMFAYVLPLRLGLARLSTLLVASVLSVPLAVFFTPLPRFRTTFSKPAQYLTSLFALVAVGLCLTVAYRLRRAVKLQ